MNIVTKVLSAFTNTTYIKAVVKTNISNAKKTKLTFNKQSAQIVNKVFITSLKQNSTVCYKLFKLTAKALQDINKKKAALILLMQLKTNNCIFANIIKKLTKINCALSTGILTNTKTRETLVIILTQSKLN